jgi:hypothetical protein
VTVRFFKSVLVSSEAGSAKVKDEIVSTIVSKDLTDRVVNMVDLRAERTKRNVRHCGLRQPAHLLYTAV